MALETCPFCLDDVAFHCSPSSHPQCSWVRCVRPSCAATIDAATCRAYDRAGAALAWPDGYY